MARSFYQVIALVSGRWEYVGHTYARVCNARKMADFARRFASETKVVRGVAGEELVEHWTANAVQ